MDYAVISKAAIHLLARREHSRVELFRKLNSRFANNIEIINQVLDTLVKENYQSDERFTEAYIRYRRERGYGPVKIKLELQERGIDADIISRLLNFNDTSWWDKIKTLRNKRYGNDVDMDYKAQMKQQRFFAQRGFTQDQIKSLANIESD